MGHLLVLGWNDKAPRAIENFRADPRYANERVVIVAELEAAPIDDAAFVAGPPEKAHVLERADAATASVAIVFASGDDTRADHQSAIIVASLRRLNPEVVIGVEMVDDDNREHLLFAGANALVDDTEILANLLVRSVQDIGVSDVVCELIASEVGSEIYRVPVDPAFVGKPWRDYASALVDRRQSALGLARDGAPILNPEPDEPIRAGDEAFVIAPEPP